MCTYCDQFFVVPPDEHGEIDVCPNCYQEYAPWMAGTEQEAKEAWRIFERGKLAEGTDASLLQSLFKTFERIREELRAGKTAVLAIATSFNRVFMTLVDTHLAALISAAFLFLFGTGPIKGFAVTLA